MPSDLEKGTEAARYFNHVGYLRSVLCPQEGINSDDLYMQRERLYSSNKLEALFSEPLPSAPRIESSRGSLTTPPSHTTVRALSHTAVLDL